MLNRIEERVYYSLIGELVEEERLPWVENAFAGGSPCDRAYIRVMEASERLCGRLGSGEEDADVEIIIDSMMEIQRLLCMKMFECGIQYVQRSQ